jgi:hypothetical protein
MQSEAVCGLEHNTTASFGLIHYHNHNPFTKPAPQIAQVLFYGVRVHSHACPQHIKVLKHFIHPIWTWDAL